LEGLGWRPTEPKHAILVALATRQDGYLPRIDTEGMDILVAGLGFSGTDCEAVHEFAAKTLLTFGDAAVPSLVKLLMSEYASHFGADVGVEILAKNGSAEAVQGLKKVLIRGENKETRSKAASALKSMGWKPEDQVQRQSFEAMRVLAMPDVEMVKILTELCQAYADNSAPAIARGT